MVANNSGGDDGALVYGTNGRMAVGKIQKTIAVFAAFFMLAACQSATVQRHPVKVAAAPFPPPQAMRKMQYPCWRGVGLIDALLEDGMEPIARGVLLRRIDPSTPLIEFWENEDKFAIVAVYPQHGVVCAVLVGDALDGT